MRSRPAVAITTFLLCLAVMGLGSGTRPAAGSTGAHRGRASAATAANPLDGRSMWIWYLSRSDGGSLAAIIARAHAAGVSTLIVKSSDGTNYWSQFTSGLARTLHAAGLHVCAWQYVYGTDPLGEAASATRGVRAGADCLVIDAEAEYESRYASAQAYISSLRASVGPTYPLALASFPYADYHPAFPYSVFLGPGGAQFDLPQMYWKDIGSSVASVFAHTYIDNRIYGRPIYPLGQTYGAATASEVQQFRALTVRYQARGVSWWDFAWTSAGGLWPALDSAWAPVRTAPLGYPTLALGAAGDDVLWLQEHLARAFPQQGVDGRFGAQTRGLLAAFQAHRHLTPTGSTDPATWRSLLALSPVPVRWRSARSSSVRERAGGAQAPAPVSARLRARAYEIPELGSAQAGLDPTHTDP